MTGLPLPKPSVATKPYWAALKEHRLVTPRCRPCGHEFFPPQPRCPQCLSNDIELVSMSGRGVVHSCTVVHRPVSPAFTPPYVIAIVELAEGTRMASNIIDCDPASVAIGMEVEVAFKDVSDEIALPYFRPVGSASSEK